MDFYEDFLVTFLLASCHELLKVKKKKKLLNIRIITKINFCYKSAVTAAVAFV